MAQSSFPKYYYSAVGGGTVAAATPGKKYRVLQITATAAATGSVEVRSNALALMLMFVLISTTNHAQCPEGLCETAVGEALNAVQLSGTLGFCLTYIEIDVTKG